MSETAQSAEGRFVAFLNYTALLAIMTVIAAIQTAALVMQYGFGELPCPLCLLQRIAMFGVCFGILVSFRNGHSARDTGICLVFAVLLLVVAERQSLLDIYARPGHAYVGSAVLGLHMPVWGAVIGIVLVIAFALKLTILGEEKDTGRHKLDSFPTLSRLSTLVGGAVMLLCLVNLASAFLQCGFSECHTFGYRLLGGPTTAPTG